MKKSFFILFFSFLFFGNSYSQGFGLKADAGINPYFTVGGYYERSNLFFDLNYSYNGKISGSGSSTFVSSSSPILLAELGYIFTLPKTEKIELSSAVGFYYQKFKGKVSNSLIKYSQFGSEANNSFSNFMFSASVRYNYSPTIKFIGKINYFLQSGDKTYWLYFPSGLKIGSSINSINGPGLSVGIIYFLRRK